MDDLVVIESRIWHQCVTDPSIDTFTCELSRESQPICALPVSDS